MKAELNREHTIVLVAETVTEAFALQYLIPAEKKVCSACGQIKIPITIDCSILDDMPSQKS